MKCSFMKFVQYALMYLSSKAFNLSMTWMEYHRLCTMEDVISHCEKYAISIHMHAIWTEYVCTPLLQNIQFVRDAAASPLLVHNRCAMIAWQ